MLGRNRRQKNAFIFFNGVKNKIYPKAVSWFHTIVSISVAHVDISFLCVEMPSKPAGIEDIFHVNYVGGGEDVVC